MTAVGGEQRLIRALLLTGGFAAVEAAGGLVSGSLALLADAGHMLADAAALALALIAARISRQSSDERRSYGYHRVPVLVAFLNAAGLFAIAVWIVIEAVQRMLIPIPIMGDVMLTIAVLGLLVNVAALKALGGSDQSDLNFHGARLHVLGDLLGSGAAIAAAGVVLVTGWVSIDPLLSVIVAAVILRGAWTLLRRSGHILIEGVPDGLDVKKLRTALVETVAGLDDIHHVHAWSLTPERSLITLHAQIANHANADKVLGEVRTALSANFGIEHSTVQVERSGCADDSGSSTSNANASCHVQ